jgi:hypothetical protein
VSGFAEEIGNVQLARRSGLRTDRGAIQIAPLGYTKRLARE